MKNPIHPGKIIRHDCLEPLGLSVTAGAKILGVTRQTLSKIVNGKSGISREMATRLTKAFGSSKETWLRMQQASDRGAKRYTLEELLAKCNPKTEQTQEDQDWLAGPPVGNEIL